MTRGGWRRRAAAALGILVLAIAAAAAFGELRWRWRTHAPRTGLGAAPDSEAAATFDPRELEGLPAPVRRYFEKALRPGQPVIRRACLTMEGTFLADPARSRWVPFTADQLVVARPPGFDWDARMRVAPAVAILVHDSYRAGRGMLRAEALGLVTVAAQEGTADAARGELMRWLAEGAWIPTALLPSQGILWEAIDEGRAKATLADRGTTVSIEMRFGPDGLVASVFAADRPRTVGDGSVPTPWEGTWTAWSPRNGMRVPSAGEVAWLLPEGRLPYWRARVTSVVYDFANEEPPGR